MKRIIFLFLFFSSCRQHNSVKITEIIDPEIVLINIEDGDRSFIGKLLQTIDSCNPKVIGIDAWFAKEKDKYQDSILLNSLKIVNNDILAYTLDSSGKPLKSLEKFRHNASDEGLAVVESVGGLESSVIPIAIIAGIPHESFALKIIKKWKPGFVTSISKEESIPVNFTRTLNQFIHFNGSELTSKNNFEALNNKIVLLGYLGPSNEDKHFTPIRQVLKFKKNEPDTYGLVIIANEIRTIPEYHK